MLYDDFQYINIIAVRKKILFLCLENIATQKRGNIKSPAKSESFPVNQFPKVVLKKKSFNKRIMSPMMNQIEVNSLLSCVIFKMLYNVLALQSVWD